MTGNRNDSVNSGPGVATLADDRRQLRYRHAFQLAPSGMLITALGGKILEANDAFCLQFEYRPEQLLELNVLSLMPTDPQLPRVLDSLPIANGETGYRRHDGDLICAGGEPISVVCEMILTPAAGGDEPEILWQITDVSLARQHVQELRRMADQDSLTGLLNRRSFETRIAEAVNAALEGGSESALLFIDVDNFKTINDRWGHTVGDRVLQAIADVLRRSVRSADAIARLGGDEFALLMFGCPTGEAIHTAQKIVAATHEIAVSPRDDWHVSVSVGVAAVAVELAATANPTATADAAMYRAKLAGGNRYTVGREQDLVV